MSKEPTKYEFAGEEAQRINKAVNEAMKVLARNIGVGKADGGPMTLVVLVELVAWCLSCAESCDPNFAREQLKYFDDAVLTRLPLWVSAHDVREAPANVH